MMANQPLLDHERQGYYRRGSQYYRGDSPQSAPARAAFDPYRGAPGSEQDLVWRARGGDADAIAELRRRDAERRA